MTKTHTTNSQPETMRFACICDGIFTITSSKQKHDLAKNQRPLCPTCEAKFRKF